MTDSTSVANNTNIHVNSYIFDINFSNHNSHVVTCYANGSINIFDYTLPYNTYDCTPLYSYTQLHSRAVRSVAYSYDSTQLYSVSSDKSFKRLDIEQNTIIDTIENLHSTGINIVQCINNNMIVTADDDGYLNVLDIREKYKSTTRPYTDKQPNVAMQFNDAGDYISDLLFMQSKGYSLCATSGDGYLYVYDLRGKGKSLAISDNLDTELLCITSVHNNERICVGDRDNKLHIFTTDLYRWPTDHIVGHVQAIDSIVTIDDSTVATGSSDGLIRLIQVQPNKCIGVIGQHSSTDTIQKQYKQKQSNSNKPTSVNELLHSDSSSSESDTEQPVELHTSDFDSSEDDSTIDTTAITVGSDLPIERLRVTHHNDKHVMASTSHDLLIKIWNIDYLYEYEDENENQDIDVNADNEPINNDAAVQAQHLARVINEATSSDSDAVDDNDSIVSVSDNADSDTNVSDTLHKTVENTVAADQPIDANIFLNVDMNTVKPTIQQSNLSTNKHTTTEPIKTHKLTERDRKQQLIDKLRAKLAAKQDAALNADSNDSDSDDETVATNASSSAVSSTKKRRRGKQVDSSTSKHNKSFYADL